MARLIMWNLITLDGFFEGPGRYGIITTLCVALLAGRGLEQLLRATRACLHRRAVTLMTPHSLYRFQREPGLLVK